MNIPKAWLITPQAPLKAAIDYATIQPEDVIIAVDGGFERCLELNLSPRLLIGDMDSLTPELLKKVPATCEVQTHPMTKNETDTQLALLYCIREGIPEIIICNDLTGRFDHAVALTQNMGEAKIHGIRASIVSEKQIVTLLDVDAEYHYPKGTIITLLSATPEANVFWSEGLKYPLRDLTFYIWQSRGVSNVATQDKQSIYIKNGALLVIATLQ